LVGLNVYGGLVCTCADSDRFGAVRDALGVFWVAVKGFLDTFNGLVFLAIFILGPEVENSLETLELFIVFLRRFFFYLLYFFSLLDLFNLESDLFLAASPFIAVVAIALFNVVLDGTVFVVLTVIFLAIIVFTVIGTTFALSYVSTFINYLLFLTLSNHFFSGSLGRHLHGDKGVDSASHLVSEPRDLGVVEHSDVAVVVGFNGNLVAQVHVHAEASSLMFSTLVL